MNRDEAAAFWCGLTIGIFFSIVLWGTTRTTWRMDLVARDLAQYCPADGAFAFKEECKQ